MTGLENIVSIIRQDAQNEAAATIDKAQAEAQGIIDRAKAEAEERGKLLIKSGADRADDIIERAESAAQLETKKALLSAKQRLLRNIIDEAKVQLENLEDKDYFDVLIQLLKKYSTHKEGFMLLNEGDLQRLPSDFEAKVKEIGNIAIGKEPAGIKNGFLLIYGGIDINCTFDALFEDSAEDLQDLVSGILFA